MDFMSQAQNPPYCEHHWVHHKGAGSLVWVKQCSICYDFDIKDLNEQIHMLIQVGVHNALKENNNGSTSMV